MKIFGISGVQWKKKPVWNGLILPVYSNLAYEIKFDSLWTYIGMVGVPAWPTTLAEPCTGPTLDPEALAAEDACWWNLGSLRVWSPIRSIQCQCSLLTTLDTAVALPSYGDLYSHGPQTYVTISNATALSIAILIPMTVASCFIQWAVYFHFFAVKRR